MAQQEIFSTGSIYHLYNRGVAKQSIFTDARDYYRFLTSLAYYQEAKPISSLKIALQQENFSTQQEIEPIAPLVEILGYCLMPNHYHLIVRQLADGGITRYMKQAMNSYTRAYNTRHNRVGPLYQGIVRAVLVDTDEQLLQLSRYVHLNPFVAKLSNSIEYEWSSYSIYLKGQNRRLCHTDLIIQMVGSPEKYKDFVEDYASFAQSIGDLKRDLALEFN